MLRPLLVSAIACSFLLAGCATPAPDANAKTSEPPKQYEKGVSKIDLPTLPREPPKDGERTLAAAPQWRLGEWWTFRMEDQLTGRTLNATRVVAGSDGPNYLVGFPIEAFSNDVLVLHLPGYGDVAKSNLSFEVHDVVFSPLEFPLTETRSWPTRFEGRPGNVTAEPQPDGTAKIFGSGQGWAMTAVYDPKIGEIAKLDYPGYASYEVTGHGYGYEGVVRVPHAHDLVFQHGRLGPLLDVREDLGPAGVATTVTDTVEVPPGYDQIGFALIALNVAPFFAPQAPAMPASGYYKVTARAPDGTMYELESLPNDAPTKISFHGAPDPTGPWELSYIVAGPGLGMAEGIGYHSIDVELPSGCVVASFNAQHHAAPCKVGGIAPASAQA